MMQPTAPLVEFLSKSPFFGGIEPAAAEFLTEQFTERRYAKGETVVREGEPGRSMFIVHTGVLHLCRLKPDGQAMRLRLIHQGDFVGATALVDMEPRPFTVVADQESVLLELTCQDLYKLYRKDLKAWSMVVMNINRELCRHLRSAGQLVSRLMEGKE